MASPFVLSALVRRWYVLLACLIAVAALLSSVYRSSQPIYGVNGSLAVTQSPALVAAGLPEGATGGVVTNPFVDGGGANVLASLLEGDLNNFTVQAQVLGVGHGVTVAQDDTIRQLLTFTAVARSAQGARDAAEEVIAGAPAILAAIQQRAGSPADQLYTTVPSYAVSNPVLSYPDRLRAIVGLALGGVLAAVVLTLVLDRLIVFAGSVRGDRRRQGARRVESNRRDEGQRERTRT